MKYPDTNIPSEQNSVSVSTKHEQVFYGLAVTAGISIGPAYVYSKEAPVVEIRQVEREHIEAQCDRFELAVERSEKQLQKIMQVAGEKIGPESAAIFEAQMLMLRDPSLYQAVLERIRNDLWSADYAVQSVMDRYRQHMELSNSEYLRERSQDFLDVQHRLIRNLHLGKLVSRIDEHHIVVAHNLTAADLILFSRRHVLGCAIDLGGATSHVSIMARALEIPTVAGLRTFAQSINSGDLVILDGIRRTCYCQSFQGNT